MGKLAKTMTEQGGFTWKVFLGVEPLVREISSRYTPFFILVSGLWEIFNREVKFRDF
jgi:hypothetical protein